MAKKIYTNGGVKYLFDEDAKGKWVLQSLKIFGKEFVFPNGGIMEKEIEAISQSIEETITKPNNNTEIDRMEEIVEFLKGYPEGSTLKEIIESIESESLSNLTDEEMESWYNDDNDPDTP